MTKKLGDFNRTSSVFKKRQTQGTSFFHHRTHLTHKKEVQIILQIICEDIVSTTIKKTMTSTGSGTDKLFLYMNLQRHLELYLTNL